MPSRIISNEHLAAVVIPQEMRVQANGFKFKKFGFMTKSGSQQDDQKIGINSSGRRHRGNSMAGQKTSLTNSDLDILKDEPGSYMKQERRYHQYVEDHREPDTAERPVNHSSEVDFRPQSLLKH